jgi:hypothetical protein
MKKFTLKTLMILGLLAASANSFAYCSSYGNTTYCDNGNTYYKHGNGSYSGYNSNTGSTWGGSYNSYGGYGYDSHGDSWSFYD